MLSIMQSIHPKWCELIASGKKKVEVRKTRPKIDPPFKVYMYCTKVKMRTKYVFRPEDYPEYMRPDVPVFCKDTDWSSPYCSEVNGNGKVIGEYICDSLIQIGYNKNGYGLDDLAINGVIAKSCIEEKELYRYLKGKKPYLYNISDLVIYDEPRELGEFKQCHKCEYYKTCNEHECSCDGVYNLSHAPQDWFYVEELS